MMSTASVPRNEQRQALSVMKKAARYHRSNFVTGFRSLASSIYKCSDEAVRVDL